MKTSAYRAAHLSPAGDPWPGACGLSPIGAMVSHVGPSDRCQGGHRNGPVLQAPRSLWGPAMGLGAAVTVAVPAKEVRSFLLEQLLRQPPSPQPEQRPHHVLVLRHAVVEQPRDLFPNLGARCYPGHGSGFPFLLRKELVSPNTTRVAQAVNFYRNSATSPLWGAGGGGVLRPDTYLCRRQRAPAPRPMRLCARRTAAESTGAGGHGHGERLAGRLVRVSRPPG